MSKHLKFLILVSLFLPIFLLNLLYNGENQYVYLAYALSKGSFSLIDLPRSLADFTIFGGKYYWPLGPFPAFLILPFSLIFKTNFIEGAIKFPLTVANFFLVYKIFLSLKLKKEKALLVATFFIFSSVYTPVAVLPFSSYFAHVVTTTLLLLCLFEALNKKRWYLIGIFLSFAVLTRPTTICALVFFAYLLKKEVHFLANLIKLILPVLMALIFVAYYNYARFANIFDSGYKYQLIPDESIFRRNSGLFSLKFIPSNLYYMLIKSPDPVLDEKLKILKYPFVKFNPYGMSIFILSPILFLIVKVDFSQKLVKLSAATVLLILIPVLTYYGIGWRQIGYRYALDFFPFLLVILGFAIKRVRFSTIIILVILGILTTWFFIIEAFLGYL